MHAPSREKCRIVTSAIVAGVGAQEDLHQNAIDASPARLQGDHSVPMRIR